MLVRLLVSKSSLGSSGLGAVSSAASSSPSSFTWPFSVALIESPLLRFRFKREVAAGACSGFETGVTGADEKVDFSV